MQVAILIGSDSDWPGVEQAWQLLREFGLEVAVGALSAHRTPEDCLNFVRQGEEAGVQVFLAAAGLTAHLPGAVAAHTLCPVIGLPLAVGPLGGLDALSAMAQMPGGTPVATVGIGNARNAALLAVEIIALGDSALQAKLKAYRQEQRRQVLARDLKLRAKLEARE